MDGAQLQQDLINYVLSFKPEQVWSLVLMFGLGLLAGYAIWSVDGKRIKEVEATKERALNHAAERERSLARLREEQRGQKSNPIDFQAKG